MNSWTKVENGFIDAEGAFQTTNTATQRALEIVQGDEGASLDEGFRFVRTGGDNAFFAAAPDAMLSPQQVSKFKKTMGLALWKAALGWKALKKVKKELQNIHALRVK